MPHSQANRRARSTSIPPAIHLIAWLLCLPLIAWAIPAPAHAQNPAPAHANVTSLPNIVLCMGDDHGWDETSYNQHPFLQTPNLDAMAAGGLRLDRFYAAHPTCSPTRGSVLTGRHPNRYGTFRPNYSIRPEEITIAQQLRQRGYATAHFGKWHLGPVKADSPTNPGAMGFDTWLSHDNFFELNPILSRDGKSPATHPGESSAVLVNAATEFMETCRRQDRPYFVVIWFGSPHEPYSGLPEDLAKYQHVRSAFAEQTVRLTSNETGRPTVRPLGDVLQERYAEIAALDRAVGTLRQWLRDSDSHTNTLLWYCGDNGSPSGASQTLSQHPTQPLRGQKADIYEGGIRVPGIVEWPAVIAPGSHSDVPCVTSDMLPTLCGITDTPLPSRPLDGVSLLPLFRGEAWQRQSPICFWRFAPPPTHEGAAYLSPAEQSGTTPLVKQMNGKYTRDFRNHHVAATDHDDLAGERAAMLGRWKWVVLQKRGEPAQTALYDLASDPAETTDVSTQHRGVAEQLQRLLLGWQNSVLQSLTERDYRTRQ